MTQLNVTHSSSANERFFDVDAGRTNAAFIYVVKGEVEVRSTRDRQRFCAGTLFYLPSGLRYAAKWSGKDGIEYYGMYSVSRHYDTSTPDEFALQEIEKPWKNEADNVIRNIFELMATEERIKKIHAVAAYYEFYANAIPRMRPAEPVRHNPALLRALDILDAHYAENLSVAELAQECFISESRLYHLFQHELQLTPVAYRNELRIRAAAELLKNREISVEAIAAEIGFQSAAHFREVFRSFTGLSPSEYRASL